MYRLAEEDLKIWFSQKMRLPLIIRGARQVGKSTLVRIFCKKNNLQLIEFNLEKVQFNSLNNADFELNALIDEIVIKSKTKLNSKSLIFFDEIQESPQLLKFLRYFAEERPELAVVAAGSLLEFLLKNEAISFPVGRVSFYHLGPMTFDEFLLANKADYLLEKIKKLEFSETVNKEAKKYLSKYFYVGGLPRAVKIFVDENSLIHVREVQEQIIQTYLADFSKYKTRIKVDRIEKIFFSCMLQLGKKIIYQKIDSEVQSKDIRKIIELLSDARVIRYCWHTNANSNPLLGEADLSIFKLYFLDIGLLNAGMDLGFEEIDNEFKMLAEQFVAQHLPYLEKKSFGSHLFYWLKDKTAQKAELDFICSINGKILPLEVKAAKAGHLKSLFYFAKEKNKKVAIKCSLDDYSIEKVSHKIDGDIQELTLITLPLYALEQLPLVLDQLNVQGKP